MKISVVVPAHNEQKYIGDCLESLKKYAANELFEIIVVDNASTDKTAEIVKSFEGVKLVAEPQKGLTKARQAGLNAASGDLVAYLDADSRISENWLKIVKREFETDSKLICLSGPYLYYDLPRHQQKLINFYLMVFAFPVYYMIGYLILGGNFVTKREALNQIGGFDIGISFYGEDTNIARRLSKLGRVKFMKEFFVFSSGRRLAGEGFLRSTVVYALNYLSEALFHKQVTKEYQDIR